MTAQHDIHSTVAVIQQMDTQEITSPPPTASQLAVPSRIKRT